MSLELTGKVVVVTGGGRGIGKAHALACAKAGASVLVADLGADMNGRGSDPRVATEVVAQIESSGGRAAPCPVDVAGPAAAARIVQTAQKAFGRVDVVINAAGLVARRTVLKMDDALLDRAIAVHVKASFSMVRAAARAMIDQGDGGSIVFHTGPVAFFGAARQGALGATGAAVAGLVRSSAIELRKHRIRVNAIAPTARTRTTEDLPLFRGIAEDSMGPEFVAPVGVYLASALSRQVTGEVIGVAGARLYSFRTHETPGFFGPNKPLSAEDVAAAWPDIVRA